MNNSQLAFSGIYVLFSLMTVSIVKVADILIIESYHADFYWDKEYKKGISDNLISDYRLSYFQMDTKRLPTDKHLEMAESAWQKYLVLKPDEVEAYVGGGQHVFSILEVAKKVLTDKANEIDFIVVGLYQTIVDEKGNHISAEQVNEWTSANSDIPAFGFWDFSIGKNKAIGGLVIKGYEQGYTAAKIIKRIVAGESVAAIRP